jgi:hypothetical protein
MATYPGPQYRLWLLRDAADVNGDIADFRQDAQGYGKLIIAAIDDLAIVNGDVLTRVRGD